MFSLASGLYQAYLAPAKLNVLLIGVEGTGKTTLLERCKVTEFSSYSSGGGGGRSTATSTRTALVRTLKCPAPKRYVRRDDDDDDDEDDDDDSDDDDEYDETNEKEKQKVERRGENINNQEGENDDDDDGEEGYMINQSRHPLLVDTQQKTEESSKQNYNLKPGAKMLPCDRVRRTVGMNLAKITICGCHCQFWDLGGSMRSLWERYYPDADAVILVLDDSSSSSGGNASINNNNNNNDTKMMNGSTVKNISENNNGNNNGSNNNQNSQNNMIDKNNNSSTTLLLQEVMAQVDEQVPLMVFCNIKKNSASFSKTAATTAAIAAAATSPSSSMPSPNILAAAGVDNDPRIRFFWGSAKTGKGVTKAMEWLIPLAKRQQQLRASSSS